MPKKVLAVDDSLTIRKLIKMTLSRAGYEVDEATLKQIADITGGEYYPAASAGELQRVFQNLPTYLIAKHETSEISVIFAALGALLATAAVVLSLRWHPLP